jgi:hypothetical protein
LAVCEETGPLLATKSAARTMAVDSKRDQSMMDSTPEVTGSLQPVESAGVSANRSPVSLLGVGAVRKRSNVDDKTWRERS